MIFSIIVPVYNVEKYLPECLTSIENQTFQDFELILVDDGSTDRSGELCDLYAEKHKNTVVIHKKNEGLVLTRRRGIKEAKGEYITFCDSDDFISDDMLNELNTIIKKNNPDMVMYGFNIVDDDHNALEECFHVFPDGTVFNDNNREELLLKFSTSVWLNSMDTKATRKELFDREKDYSAYQGIKMGEDQMQVIPLIKNSKTFYFCEKPLCYYRYNPNGISKKLTADYLNDYLKISEMIYSFLQEEHVSTKTINTYYNRYLLDVYKYLLKYCRAGMGREVFKQRYNQVAEHGIFIKAQQSQNSWDWKNRVLYKVVRPDFYLFINWLFKITFHQKLR